MNKTWLGSLVCSSLVCIVTLAASGCADNGTTGEAEAQAPLTEEGRPGPQHRGGGGPEMLLVAALHELDLSAAQAATIQGALDALPRPTPGERPDAAGLETLVAGVRAGEVDVDAVLAAADASGGDFRAAVAGAIQTLHDTLDADQRAELVERVEARMEEHPRPSREGGGPLEHLLADLELSAEQQQAIQAALPEPEELAPPDLAAFVADDFDAAAVAPPPRLQHLAEALAVIVPLLDEAQREALATRLESPPPPPHAPPAAEEG